MSTTMINSSNGSANGVCETTCDNAETTGSNSNSKSDDISRADAISINTNMTIDISTEVPTEESAEAGIERLTAVDTRKDPADVLPDDLFLKIFDYLPEYYLSIASLVW